MPFALVSAAFGPKIKTKPEPVAASSTRRSSIWRHTDDVHVEMQSVSSTKNLTWPSVSKFVLARELARKGNRPTSTEVS